MKPYVFFSVCAILAALFFNGCGGSGVKKENGPVVALSDSITREQTLCVGGFQWGPPTSFNPLAISPAWPVTGNMNLIYEALFGFDQLDGTLKGIIGTQYRIAGDTLDVALNSHAKWHNGSRITAQDVIYSFELHKKYATHFSNTWNFISDVVMVDSLHVQFILSNENRNPLVLRDIIASVQILPRYIFKPLEKRAFDDMAAEAGTAPSNTDVLYKIREFTNDTLPEGSGPYTLRSYTDTEIVLQRVDSYWGNVLYSDSMPAPKFIIHRSFESNDKFNQALREGSLDISQTFCPKIWEDSVHGVRTWYDREPYYIPGIIPALLMSVTKKPFNDVAFRKACAHAINYQKIRTEAMYGYSPKLRPGLIVPFGSEKEYYSNKDAAQFGKLYDPQKARALLKAAGYTWDTKTGMLNLKNPKGKLLTFYATCPSGWTDWETTIRIAVEGMRSIGINVKEKFVEYSVWDSNLKNGLFDFTMKTPLPEQAPSLPWSRFDQVMSSNNLVPVGEVMYMNEGRYQNSTADSLLQLIPHITNKTQVNTAYRALNRLFMDEMPIIPLMYRPWFFYQFSTRYWTNFPTEKNRYAPPQCLMVGAGVRGLWGIRSRDAN